MPVHIHRLPAESQARGHSPPVLGIRGAEGVVGVWVTPAVLNNCARCARQLCPLCSTIVPVVPTGCARRAGPLRPLLNEQFYLIDHLIN